MSNSKKVILTGNFGVGKTSLFNRFINNTFDDKYLTTLGVKINKKVVEAEEESVSMLLWDIAGEVKQNKVPKSYFLGAAGIIYVFDLSRPLTFDGIQDDIAYLRQVLPDATIKIVGNKKDLVNEEQISNIQEEFTNKNTDIHILTSAKTGENVENLLTTLANDLVL